MAGMPRLSESTRRSGRARGNTAAVVGSFSAAWAMAVPAAAVLTPMLNIGAVAGMVVVVLGIVMAVCCRAESSAMADPERSVTHGAWKCSRVVVVGAYAEA